MARRIWSRRLPSAGPGEQSPMPRLDEPPGEIFAKHDHAPPHLFRAGATYFITGKMLYGQPFMERTQRRQELLDSIRFACTQRGWLRVAWVALPNHYHCILKAPDDARADVSALISSVHKFTASTWNREDRATGRQVWY